MTDVNPQPSEPKPLQQPLLPISPSPGGSVPERKPPIVHVKLPGSDTQIGQSQVEPVSSISAPHEAHSKVAQVIAFKNRTNLLAPPLKQGTKQSRGSAFFIKETPNSPSPTHLMTAAHVVADTHKKGGVKLWLPQLGKDRQLGANVTTFAPEIDLAVMDLNEPVPQEAAVDGFTLGDDKLLRPGDPLLVVGYPMGDDNLKILRSTFNGLQNGVIQLDGAVNPGNSGGPVLNAQGEVVGVVSSGYDPRVANNVSFAIPISLFKTLAVHKPLQRTAQQETHVVRMPSLGIMYHNSTDIGMDYGAPECANGVTVQWVSKNSAVYGRIKPGDRICTIKAGQHVLNVDNHGEVSVPWYQMKIPLSHAIAHVPVGEPVVITYWNNQEVQALETTLQPAFSGGFAAVYPPFETIEFETFGGVVVMPLRMRHIIGFPFLQFKLTPTEREQDWLVVSHIFPNSKFAETRTIKEGALITVVNNYTVKTIDEYRRALELPVSPQNNPRIEWTTRDNVSQKILLSALLEEQPQLQEQYNLKPSPVYLYYTEDQVVLMQPQPTQPTQSGQSEPQSPQLSAILSALDRSPQISAEIVSRS